MQRRSLKPRCCRMAITTRRMSNCCGTAALSAELGSLGIVHLCAAKQGILGTFHMRVLTVLCIWSQERCFDLQCDVQEMKERAGVC